MKNLIKRFVGLTIILILSAVVPSSTSFAISYSKLDVPASTETVAYGIDGNDVVGFYGDDPNSGAGEGFLFDGSTFKTIHHPLAGWQGTIAYGIAGEEIVGSYLDGASIMHGFLYDGSHYTTIDPPLNVFGSEATGIASGKIVGYYVDAARLFMVTFLTARHLQACPYRQGRSQPRREGSTET